jgi:pimeloyl-ACP methyl ester carboxylesterase
MKTQIKRNTAKPLFYALLVAFFSLIAFTGSAKNKTGTPLTSKTFVLVHGAFQAPYCWQFVKLKLEAAGQKVVIVELAGHGQDQTDPKTISINTYRNQVIAAIIAIDGPVVLVGHSLGGAVITAVADSIPGHIAKLVYLAGLVPVNDQSIFDLAKTDTNSLFGPSLTVSEDHATAMIANDKIISVFAQDADDKVKKMIIDNNRPEPFAPQTDKVYIKNPAFAAVSKYYIQTSQDHALTIDLQNRMISASNIKNVYTVNTGHCAMLTQPDEVSKILLKIIK